MDKLRTFPPALVLLWLGGFLSVEGSRLKNLGPFQGELHAAWSRLSVGETGQTNSSRIREYVHSPIDKLDLICAHRTRFELKFS